MRMTVETIGDVKVLAIIGKLDTHTSQEAQDLLTELINKGAREIVVDLAALDYISSIGFRVFLMAAKQLSKEDGTLRICGITGNVKEVFDISGFATIFNIFDNQAAALADL